MGKADKSVKRRLAGAYISSALSISLVLLLVGITAVIGINARRVSDWFKENMQMEILLREEVTEKQAEKLKTEVEALPYVKTVSLITREQGIAELREMLGQDFMDVFESTSVPLSLELTLKADYVNTDSLAMVSARLKEFKSVDTVESRVPLVESINSNLSKLSIFLSVLILLLLFISIVLINNTMRLNIYARRFTVNTMQLVGASPSFICRPFLKDAFMLGLISSLISISLIGTAIFLAWKKFPRLFTILNPEGLALAGGIILIAGVGICLLSTYFVVMHLLYMDKDKLYY